MIVGAGVIVSSTGVVELDGQPSSGCDCSATGECLMSAVARAPCVVLTISRKAVKLLYREAPKQLQRSTYRTSVCQSVLLPYLPATDNRGCNHDRSGQQLDAGKVAARDDCCFARAHVCHEGHEDVAAAAVARKLGI